jgi:sugar/nucleoside kinase (ribokinase family)
MPTEPPPRVLDLVVVGGLTIDRFADGREDPGGSVIHIARAAAARGMQLGVVTAAGPEPIAAVALDELRSITAALEATRADGTTTFRHRESGAGRRLRLERTGGRVRLPEDQRRMPASAILFAPVADEVSAADLRGWEWVSPRGAILQGWLRSLAAGEEVGARAVADLDPDVVAALGYFSLLVASREDLAAESGDAARLLTALRRQVGPRPTIVVTDGADGLWFQVPQRFRGSAPRHVPPERRVEGVPTVGAGDVLAAFLLARMESHSVHDAWDAWPRDSMRVVEDMLQARASHDGGR